MASAKILRSDAYDWMRALDSAMTLAGQGLQTWLPKGDDEDPEPTTSRLLLPGEKRFFVPWNGIEPWDVPEELVGTCTRAVVKDKSGKRWWELKRFIERPMLALYADEGPPIFGILPYKHNRHWKWWAR